MDVVDTVGFTIFLSRAAEPLARLLSTQHSKCRDLDLFIDDVASYFMCLLHVLDTTKHVLPAEGAHGIAFIRGKSATAVSATVAALISPK